jgi:carboxymethylenebutenolidase
MTTLATIKSRDGDCPAYISRPGGTGPWPAVIMYMDAIGIRPAMLGLGERLATYGYLVLLPDVYYRGGAYEPMTFATFRDSELRKRFRDTATPDNVMSDTRAFIDYLDAQPDVRHGGIGTTGYCMGGNLSLRAAGTYPESITAAASFHGGFLATDAPESPHRLAPKMRARVYVAGATGDETFTDAMKARLEESLTQAGVDHTIETYPAKHGWVLPDSQVYDAACAERHWHTMTAFFDATLKR